MGDMSHETDERKVKREQFINDLMGFHAAVGTPLMRMPTINGRDVDLLGLYETVTTLGGWERVSDNDQWPDVVAQLELPDACVNSSVALKQIYLRFLDKYEKNNFAYKIRGEPEDEVDFNIRRMNKQQARTLYGIPTTYNAGQHYLSEDQRLQLGLEALSRHDRFEKLQLSLISPLPNEQDFAVNACALLSLGVQDRHIILRNSPRLLVNLLAHAGVFTDVYLRDYFIEQYEKNRGYETRDFWKNSLKHDALVWLSNESNFSGIQDEDCLMAEMPERSYLTENLVNYDFFIERICQVGRTILNLTSLADNALYLAGDATAMRFVLMCCDCRFKKVSELGWDIMNCLASKICVRTLGFKEITLMVKEGITSEDISEVLAALRVLGELAKVESNSASLMETVDREMFSTLCTYLTLQDVVIILCTLEALYSMSSLDKSFCDSIARTRGSLSILVLLLKFRVPLSASFGTWKNIKVSELITTEEGRHISEKEYGPLAVKLPEYAYYMNPVPMEGYRRPEAIPSCCLTGQCTRSQKDESRDVNIPNRDVITLQSSPRKNSLLSTALRNSGPNGIKPVTVATVGPAITLKAHLEEPVTKIVKISNPGNIGLINTVKNMSHNNPSLLKNVGFVAKKMNLNGKEFVVATPMSPPPKSDENSSSSDDMQVVTNNNHTGGSSEENSMDSVKSSENEKKELEKSEKINKNGTLEKDEKMDVLKKAKNEDSKEESEEGKKENSEAMKKEENAEVSKKDEPMVNGVEEVKVNGVQEPDDYLCEWRGCLRKFKDPDGVFVHIGSLHCPQTVLEGKCLWGSCTAGKMVYKILMKHIQREHCNPEVMLPLKARTGYRPRPRPKFRRPAPAAPMGPPSAMGPPGMPPPLLTASAPEQFNPAQMPPPGPPGPGLPGPQQQQFVPQPYPSQYIPRYYGPPPIANTPAGDRIAESIRLTSALVLRNVASACPSVRRRLLLYEQQIVECAALESDASKAAAECLSFLYQRTWDDPLPSPS